MTQALYRKWRPRRWDDVIGQKHVVRTLRNAVLADRVMHAYLFAGPRGTGKTSVARLLAKAVNCLAEDLARRPCDQCEHCVAVNEGRFLDLIEIDAASNTGVDDVRDLRDKINFAPSQGRYKVYIIDEVHMLSTAAFNALLKTLEEPPSHAIFVLATTEVHKIPATVLSRCQRHEFRRLPVREIVAQLEKITQAEAIEADEEALTLIARQATGSLRDAISLLDQLASTGERITLALTQDVLGTATQQTVTALVQSVLDGRPDEGLGRVHQALDAGADARALARQVVEYLRALLLIRMGNTDQVETTEEIKAQMESHARALTLDAILRMIRSFNTAATEQRGGWQPALGLELALVESLDAISPEPPGRAEPSPDRAERRTVKPKPTPLPESAKSFPRKAPPSSEPVAPASEEEGTGAAGTPAVVPLEKVAGAWKSIRALVRPQHPSVDGLLNSCTLLEVRGNVLVLGFSSPVVLEKMDKPEQIAIARRAIAQVLGVDLDIRCVLTQRQGRIPPEVKQDGMVAAALQSGGEIVDIQE